jgi:hypothetical protein
MQPERCDERQQLALLLQVQQRSVVPVAAINLDAIAVKRRWFPRRLHQLANYRLLSIQRGRSWQQMESCIKIKVLQNSYMMQT